MKQNEMVSVVLRPDWVETAQFSLINRKSKKEYWKFLEMIAAMTVNNGCLPDDLCDDSNAYKLFKSLHIEEKIGGDLAKYRKKKARYSSQSDKEKTDNQETNLGIYHNYNHNQAYNQSHNSITSTNTTEQAACNADELAEIDAEIDELLG